MGFNAVHIRPKNGGVKIMSVKVASSFQNVIETVESLSFSDQWLLIELVRKRLIEQRRAELVAEVAEARQAYQQGDVRRGTVADLMKELTA
jgi:transcriptional regulator CtsR